MIYIYACHINHVRWGYEPTKKLGGFLCLSDLSCHAPRSDSEALFQPLQELGEILVKGLSSDHLRFRRKDPRKTLLSRTTLVTSRENLRNSNDRYDSRDGQTWSVPFRALRVALPYHALRDQIQKQCKWTVINWDRTQVSLCSLPVPASKLLWPPFSTRYGG